MAELPTRVWSLLRSHITSVEQLQVLLYLHASREPHSAASVHRALKTTETSVERRLVELERAGLVVRDAAATEATFRFEPVDDELAAAVGQLARLYPTWRASIVACIYQIGW